MLLVHQQKLYPRVGQLQDLLYLHHSYQLLVVLTPLQILFFDDQKLLVLKLEIYLQKLLLLEKNQEQIYHLNLLFHYALLLLFFEPLD